MFNNLLNYTRMQEKASAFYFILWGRTPRPQPPVCRPHIINAFEANARYSHHWVASFSHSKWYGNYLTWQFKAATAVVKLQPSCCHSPFRPHTETARRLEVFCQYAICLHGVSFATGCVLSSITSPGQSFHKHRTGRN